MSFQLQPVSRADGPAPARPAPRATRGDFAAAQAATDVYVPSSPPPEAQRAVDAAARAARTLHAHGRQLHFEPDEHTGKVRVEVRDLDGNILRRLPLGEVFTVAETGRV